MFEILNTDDKEKEDDEEEDNSVKKEVQEKALVRQIRQPLSKYSQPA